ncbi:hypothetical protein JOE64_002404 [Microbacterium dextranolyticum]|nr:hypothetical protein [Microbacterium dextranolyticum]
MCCSTPRPPSPDPTALAYPTANDGAARQILPGGAAVSARRRSCAPSSLRPVVSARASDARHSPLATRHSPRETPPGARNHARTCFSRPTWFLTRTRRAAQASTPAPAPARHGAPAPREKHLPARETTPARVSHARDGFSRVRGALRRHPRPHLPRRARPSRETPPGARNHAHRCFSRPRWFLARMRAGCPMATHPGRVPRCGRRSREASPRHEDAAPPRETHPRTRNHARTCFSRPTWFLTRTRRAAQASMPAPAAARPTATRNASQREKPRPRVFLTPDMVSHAHVGRTPYAHDARATVQSELTKSRSTRETRPRARNHARRCFPRPTWFLTRPGVSRELRTPSPRERHRIRNRNSRRNSSSSSSATDAGQFRPL